MNNNWDSLPEHISTVVLAKEQKSLFWFEYNFDEFAVVLNHCNNEKTIVDADGCPVVIDKKQQYDCDLESALFLAFGKLESEITSF